MSLGEKVVGGAKPPVDVGAEPDGAEQRLTADRSDSLPRYAPSRLSEYKNHGRVLVVDDEPSIARLTSLILEQCGFEVCVATDGAEALALIETNKNELRLVLMDYCMPDFDGYAVLSAARELGCDAPMILTTGYPETQYLKQPQGFAGFLQKPYRFETLVSVLKQVLGD